MLMVIEHCWSRNFPNVSDMKVFGSPSAHNWSIMLSYFSIIVKQPFLVWNRLPLFLRMSDSILMQIFINWTIIMRSFHHRFIRFWWSVYFKTMSLHRASKIIGEQRRIWFIKSTNISLNSNTWKIFFTPMKPNFEIFVSMTKNLLCWSSCWSHERV